jgi:hypothetical protein
MGADRGWNYMLHEAFYVYATKEAVRFKNGSKR